MPQSRDLFNSNGSKGQYLLSLARCTRFYKKYRTKTMINLRPYVENLALVSLALKSETLRGGAVIECGTWKGGMAAGMIEIAGPSRRYIFFDSFAGLPPAQTIDGQAAQQWQADTTSPRYHDNCSASVEDFEDTIRMANCPSGAVEIKRGFFEDTFVGFNPPLIAVLRLDADWYAPTILCLEKFWDNVLPSGIIIIDDYYTWDGCSRAVHEFLAKKGASERIRQGPIGRVAYILKEEG
jgi:hypothetical protein